MKRISFAVLFSLLLISCGPSKYAVQVEMRHPSKSGVNLAGKNISVVYLETDDDVASEFGASMADAFAYRLEEDYGTGEGSIGIYRMRHAKGVNYATKDSLFNILIDTGADLVFFLDTVEFGNMNVGVPSKVSYKTSADSSFVNSVSMPYTIKLYCYDGMDKDDVVQAFGGSSIVRPVVYSDGKDDSTVAAAKAYKAVGPAGWDAGEKIAESFKSQWKHEQYSIVYFESEKWYKALVLADQYDWKGAIDIWFELLDSKDVIKRSSAAFNISVACYMLGDYSLALEWLDLSDSENKLSISDAMRKRILAYK